jgi:tetratricopeptide (TPR) repeat protein
MEPFHVLVCTWLSAAGALATPPSPPPALQTNLGTYHRPITSASKEAQAYFDQGLRLLYAFNHEEAQAAFEEAARLDPSCAICFWGAALTLGPNINLPAISERAEAAWAFLKKAQAKAQGASPVERALIGALGHRYAHPAPTEPKKQHALDASYADAMRQVAKRFPKDPDVATLFAESMMDLRPWDFWTLDGSPQPGTEEIVATLEGVLRLHPDHPGANHYLIHAVEASPHPERAMASAERLKTLMPGAGHLVHMPSHIYIRTGQYADGSEANRRAIAVDAASPHNHPIYAMYVAHNFQFLWASTLMEGRSAESMQAARDMLRQIPLEMLKEMPGFDSLLAYPVVGLARFGRWKEVLEEPMPPADFPTAQGLWHATRGLALLRTGDRGGAARELAEVEALRQRTPADAKVMMNSALDVLGIAVDVLKAELARANGDTATAFTRFEQAVAAEDKLRPTGAFRCDTGLALRCLPPGDPARPKPSTERTSSAIRTTAGRSLGSPRVSRPKARRPRPPRRAKRSPKPGSARTSSSQPPPSRASRSPFVRAGR